MAIVCFRVYYKPKNIIIKRKNEDGEKSKTKKPITKTKPNRKRKQIHRKKRCNIHTALHSYCVCLVKKNNNAEQKKTIHRGERRIKKTREEEVEEEGLEPEEKESIKVRGCMGREKDIYLCV